MTNRVWKTPGCTFGSQLGKDRFRDWTGAPGSECGETMIETFTHHPMKRLRSTSCHIVLAMGSIALFAGVVLAQNSGGGIATAPGLAKKDPQAVQILAPQLAPRDARIPLRQLGSRLTKPGAEKTILTGTYTDASGTSGVTITWQNPGLIRVDLTTGPPHTLVFNGKSAKGTSSAFSTTDKAILETFTDDWPESFFISLANDGVVRFLGSRFRTDDGKDPAYTGPWFDIFQKIGTIPSTEVRAQKLYFFDSTTHLLARVRYVDVATGDRVELVYSNWQTTAGESFPGSVRRIVNGTTQFTFVLGPPVLSTVGTTAVFNQP